MRLHTFLFAMTALVTFGGQSVLCGETIAEIKMRESKVRSLVDRVMPSVVTIIAADSRKYPGSGSGVVVGKDGLILTAAHVTEATRKKLIVIFPDGRRADAEALGANRGTDAAMVRITEPGEWPAVEMGSSDTLRLGDWCVAMGHPGGFSYERRPPVRLGRIWRRDLDGALFTSCPLIGGDSGGPTFDLEGRVIGINSSIHGNEVMNRHIAIDTLKDDWDRLLKGKKWGIQGFGSDAISRPKTGATFDRESQNGVKVCDVAIDTPAARAGLLIGDLVTAFDGKEVKTFHALMRLVGKRKPGDRVKLTALRGVEKKELELELAKSHMDEDEGSASLLEGPKVAEPPTPPVQLGAVLEDAGGKGARILTIREGSPAATAGLKVGDIVIALNDKPVDGPTSASEIIYTLKPNEKLAIRIQRDDTLLTVDALPTARIP